MYVVQTQPSRTMVRRCTSTPNSALSHSVITRSKPRASASPSDTGNGLPSIQSGTWTPAAEQNVGATSTSPTGRDTHRVSGVDLAHLIRGHGCRHPCCGRFVVRHEPAVVPRPPVPRLAVEHSFALGRILDVAVGQRHLAPVDPPDLRRGGIPRMV